MSDFSDVIEQIRFMEGLPAGMRASAVKHMQATIDSLPAYLAIQHHPAETQGRRLCPESLPSKSPVPA